jgi:hypothetical protein
MEEMLCLYFTRSQSVVSKGILLCSFLVSFDSGNYGFRIFESLIMFCACPDKLNEWEILWPDYVFATRLIFVNVLGSVIIPQTVFLSEQRAGENITIVS